MANGKAKGRLAMDGMPVSGQVMTFSLNSVVTDSSPGMAAYVTGSKGNNNQQGVFPDDTADAFDNPRVEYLGEMLRRRLGSGFNVGIVSTADVTDSTPAANAVHTSDRYKEIGRPISYEARGRFTELVAGRRFALANMIDFLPGVAPYENTILVEFFPQGDRVRMVVTLERMHDEEFTRMSVQGFTSQLGCHERRRPLGGATPLGEEAAFLGLDHHRPRAPPPLRGDDSEGPFHARPISGRRGRPWRRRSGALELAGEQEVAPQPGAAHARVVAGEVLA